MLLTITTTHTPATDLGHLLHKHPARIQAFELGFGQAHVFYPEATEARCTAAVDAERTELNTWIRSTDAFDGVLDFDAALRDPERPSRMLPEYDSGDHLHPGDAGLAALAESVDLRMLVP